MSILQAGAYSAAVAAIITLATLAYEANAWSADLHELQVTQQRAILGMEKRTLTRQILQWSTKPTNTEQEQQYKEAIVKQLDSDKKDVVIKMRSLR